MLQVFLYSERLAQEYFFRRVVKYRPLIAKRYELEK